MRNRILTITTFFSACIFSSSLYAADQTEIPMTPGATGIFVAPERGFSNCGGVHFYCPDDTYVLNVAGVECGRGEFGYNFYKNVKTYERPDTGLPWAATVQCSDLSVAVNVDGIPVMSPGLESWLQGCYLHGRDVILHGSCRRIRACTSSGVQGAYQINAGKPCQP